MAANRPSEAIAVLKKALELEPNNSVAYYNMGNAYKVHLKDYKSASDCYNKALELKPNFLEAWDMLGVCRTHLKDYSGAEACHKRCLSIDPNNYKCLINLGTLYYLSHRLEDCRATWLKAKALPESAGDKRLADEIDELEKQISEQKKAQKSKPK